MSLSPWALITLNRIPGMISQKDTGAGSFPGAGPATSCVDMLTNTVSCIGWNIGTWTGSTVLSWSCSQDLSGMRCRKWCIAHRELVGCLWFVIIVCSVPSGTAVTEDPVLCRLTPFALSTVTSRYMCISIVRIPSRPVCQNKIKKDLTSIIEWDIKG